MGSVERPPLQRPGRLFLQPAAAAAVFVLFALLFFTMAMLDFNRVKGLLLEGLETNARDVVRGIEEASAANYRRLLQKEADEGGFDGGPAHQDSAFSLQERLVAGLLQAARRIDRELSRPGMDEGALREAAADLDLEAIALFDDQGGLVFSTGPLPEEILPAAAALIAGPHGIAVRMLHALGREDAPGYLVVRRQAAAGALVLVLDRNGLDFRAWQTAIESALAQLHWSGDLAYLVLEDIQGKVFARAGTAQAETIEQCLLAAKAASDVRRGSAQCVRLGGMKMLQISVPFRPEGRILGTIRVGFDTHESDRLLLNNRRHIFLWTSVMVLIGLLAMVVLYHTQNRHLARLQSLQDRLQQASRLAGLGRLAAGVAHEIRNPLNAISMAVQRLQREFTPETEPKRANFQRLTRVLREEIGRLNGLVENVLGFTRTARIDLLPGSPAQVLERIAGLLRDEAQAAGVRIDIKGDRSGPRICMDPARMEEALLNIVRNAIQAVSGEGSVSLSWKAEGKDRVRIQVRDTGRGMSEEEISRIFDPFYTTKPKGVGLGLVIAHEIIAAHGGEIQVTSREGAGTTVAVLLPRAAASDVRKDAEKHQRGRLGGPQA